MLTERPEEEWVSGVKIITCTKSCMSVCVMLCVCARVLFISICVLAGINVNPSVYLIGSCGALFPEPWVLDGCCACCCIHTNTMPAINP